MWPLVCPKDMFGFMKNNKQVKTTTLFRRPETSMYSVLKADVVGLQGLHKYKAPAGDLPTKRKSERLTVDSFRPLKRKWSMSFGPECDVFYLGADWGSAQGPSYVVRSWGCRLGMFDAMRRSRPRAHRKSLIPLFRRFACSGHTPVMRPSSGASGGPAEFLGPVPTSKGQLPPLFTKPNCRYSSSGSEHTDFAKTSADGVWSRNPLMGGGSGALELARRPLC